MGARPSRVLKEADNPPREYQRRQHEEAAEEEQPDLRRRAGQPGLRQIDQHGANRRADQRAAAADRYPNRDLDRIAWRELARIDDADLRDVERPGYPGEHRRDREHEKL